MSTSVSVTKTALKRPSIKVPAMELPAVIGPPPRVLGHKRTKSAGYCPKDSSSQFKKTGLYGHLDVSTEHAGLTGGLNCELGASRSANVRTSKKRFSTSEMNVSSLSFSRMFENRDVVVNCSRKNSKCRDGQQLLPSNFGSLGLGNLELAKSKVEDEDEDEDDSNESNCGLFSFRPKCLQKMATIQVFVFISCVLVTLNQALSSGYFNRYEHVTLITNHP